MYNIYISKVMDPFYSSNVYYIYISIYILYK
jgi:hypothetical protein